MNQVGELVLCRNEIVQTTCGADRDFVAAAQRLNLITAELQESVMKTRMQPIGAVWNKLPRAVRDIALACGKSVRVVMEGAETELVKTLIEAIKDPLTHLVRNAVDHGIESPGERAMRASPRRARYACGPSRKTARSRSPSPTTARGSTPSACDGRRSRAASSAPRRPAR